MDYFFVLGNHPALSTAELLAVLPGAKNLRFYGEVLVMSLPKNSLTKDFLKSFGGTIKFGQIEERLNNSKQATAQVVKILDKYLPISGKFSFGLSSYGKGTPLVKVVGMTIKNALREKNISCRWVTSREQTLSSVVVEQNKLLTTGKEIVFLGNGQEVLIGTTINVQPFKELSSRDYGRPARDDYSGMLPPKLAQIMINLAQAKNSEIILDPFCGSGTILTEAMLLGYQEIIGTDISPKAITDSQKNIDWFKKKYNLKNKVVVKVTDVRKLNTLFKDNSLGAIVGETYLGPQRGRVDFKKVKQELSELYNQTFKVLYKILKPGHRLVLAVPIFMNRQEPEYLNLNFSQFKSVALLPKDFISLDGQTKRQTLIYGRSGQKVFREIIVLEK